MAVRTIVAGHCKVSNSMEEIGVFWKVRRS